MEPCFGVGAINCAQELFDLVKNSSRSGDM